MVDDFHAAHVALLIGGRLLITLRDDKPDILFPNMWDLPGGGREGDETPFDTMARETWEEVSVNVPRKALIWKKCYPTGSVSGEPVWFFAAELPAAAEKEVALGDEGQAWKLVRPETYLTMPNTIPNLVSRLQDWRVAMGLA